MTRGLIYVLLASLPVWVEFLDGDAELTSRKLVVVSLSSIVAGLTALRAYLDQHLSRNTTNTIQNENEDSVS